MSEEVDGKYIGNLFDDNKGKQKSNKKSKFYFLMSIFCMLLVGIGIGFFVGSSLNQELGVDEALLIKVAYAGTECDLRSTQEIRWMPNMIIQEDSNGNVFGSPNCIPIDRITGERVKNK